MNHNGADVIGVGFEGGDLLRGIVVVYSELEVIAAADNPVLARNEATRSYRDICKFECLYYCLYIISISTKPNKAAPAYS